MSIRWRGTPGFEPGGRRFDSDMENALVEYPMARYVRFSS